MCFSGTPIPDHISAKWEDVPELISGLVEANKKLTNDIFDPVIACATLAFGFVFIHTFEDGNGRIHRYIILDMPVKTKENLIGFLRQNSGSLSNRAWKKEFTKLTEHEIYMFEEASADIYG